MAISRDEWKTHQQSLTDAAAPGLVAAEGHARYLAQVVTAAFGANSRISVGAVGGLGRFAVAPFGDADLWVFGDEPREVEESVQSALYPLWDAGVPVSHQLILARDIVELARQDLRNLTSLLDLRPIVGPPGLVEEALQLAARGLFSEGELPRFFARLEDEARARHVRFGGSVYLLEPDVKSGPGGMRDLDSARWMARARYRVGSQGRTFSRELLSLGVLVAREADELDRAQEFLWRVRHHLHVRAGRRVDRLTFEAQEALAIDMGYAARNPKGRDAAEDDPEASEELTLAVERFMQDYYRHARVVARARESLLQRCMPITRRHTRPKERDLAPGIVAFDEQVAFARGADLAADPATALRLYAVAARERLPILPAARELCVRYAPDPSFGQVLRASSEASSAFIELLCDARAPDSAKASFAEELHETGLLLAMIPEFAPVTGRVHHDLYHVYTVDVHSVAALRTLAVLRRGEPAFEDGTDGEAIPDGLLRRLAAEVAAPAALCLATLLHDVGKGYPEADGSRKNHSKRGAELAGPILDRLLVSKDVQQEVLTLIEQHLAMYHLATRRDLDDPRTVEECARLVGNRETLRNLFLLTIVDLRTTSPKALTAWKAKMLEELYILTDAYFEGTPSIAGRDSATTIRALCKDAAVPDAFLTSFARTMPSRYALTTTEAIATAHVTLAWSLGAKRVAFVAQPTAHPDIFCVALVAKDEPGLLSRLAAALWVSRLVVLSASVYSREPEMNVECTNNAVLASAPSPVDASSATQAVDVFYVRTQPGRAFPQAALERHIERLCEAHVDPEALIASLGLSHRPSAGLSVKTEVLLDDRASLTHTVVEAFGKDRPGLLYALSRALTDLGLSISVSKINTEGERVADVFYVAERAGGKIAVDARRREVKETLMSVLAGKATSSNAKGDVPGPAAIVSN